MSIPKNNHEQMRPPTNKYRMRICDAPPELLEFIKRSEEERK